MRVCCSGIGFSIDHGENLNPMKINCNEHMHSRHEMLLIVRGNASYCINGYKFKLNHYDLLFIPANTYHFLIPEDESTYENFVINVDENFFDEERFQNLFTPPYRINIRKDEVMVSLFENYKSLSKFLSEEDLSLMARNIVEQIIICSMYKPKQEKMNEKSTVSVIVEYIAQHIEEPLDSKKIADEFSFTSSYIQNIFSKEMGIGIKHYINQKKIYAAHRDIQNGISPSEAADKYGYQNYSSFYRQYIKYFGSSPRKK